MAEVSVATTIARGAMAGAAATVPMTAVFVAARAVGAIDDFPPVQIVARVVGLRRSRRHPIALRRWAMIAHLAFGAGAGSTFGLLCRHAARKTAGARTVTGIVWGVAVWLGSYEGWLPLLGILPPAHRENRPRTAAIGLAHVVWGAALARLLSPRP